MHKEIFLLSLVLVASGLPLKADEKEESGRPSTEITILLLINR